MTIFFFEGEWMDCTVAPMIFNLWEKLFNDKNLFIVESRYARLKIGNDMFDGAAYDAVGVWRRMYSVGSYEL